MIKVESITIEEFRGIRNLTLDFQGENFAICGPNGTGKSGVIDAIEFALTGHVSRLSGEGRGDVSLKNHGPHVDIRDDPEKSHVTLRLTIPNLSEKITVVRSPKSPSNPVIEPCNEAILDVLQRVEAHPEIVLSRRELIRYVLATPGKRAEEIQALLHLDRVEKVRAGLQKIANRCERLLTSLKSATDQALAKLLEALEISRLSKAEVLAAANGQRVLLGLPALSDLTETTSLKDGMATPIPAKPERIPKAHALAEISGVREALANLTAARTSRWVRN